MPQVLADKSISPKKRREEIIVCVVRTVSVPRAVGCTAASVMHARVGVWSLCRNELMTVSSPRRPLPLPASLILILSIIGFPITHFVLLSTVILLVVGVPCACEHPRV